MVQEERPAHASSGPGLWDVALGLVLVALCLRILSGSSPAPGFREADALAYLLTAVGAAAAIWARRQPMAALMVVSVCSTALAWRDNHVDVLPFVVTGLLFMVASYRTRRAAVLGLGMTAAFLALAAASQPADLGLIAAVQSLAIFVAAWTVGRAARSRRKALLASISAAQQQAESERQLAAAERDRNALTAMEERLRIARELHDVLAHSISVISVQATVGEHLATNDLAAARRALLTISDVSRASLQELRQILTLLRDEPESGTTTGVSYQPARGLDDLEELVDTYRSAGLPVSTSTSGPARPLSAAAGLCAYRIVQEALTNTLKHAGPSSASVLLAYDEQVLRVTITDDGRGSGPLGSGHGLAGMQERAALLGGRLETGGGRDGGFTVTATIPYEPDAAEPVQGITR